MGSLNLDLKARRFEVNNYKKDNLLMPNNTNRKKPGYFYAVNGEYGTLIQFVMDFGDPKFPDIQIADFPMSRRLGWAPLGPTTSHTIFSTCGKSFGEVPPGSNCWAE